jgi:peptidoglycan/LPS O-acetylase OafA/YrhL
MTTAIKRERHIPALDGLRGIAIISVILVHANLFFGGQFGAGPNSRLLAVTFGAGWVGVDLFFVLSGFLITGILCDAKGSRGFLRNFWARRALRILPLYFGYLAFIIATRAAKPISNLDLLSLVGYYYNFWFALVTQKPVGSAHHFWSLAVEEHFYLVWPFLVMLFAKRDLLRICVAGFAVSFILRLAIVCGGLWLSIAYFITPCRLDGLLAGAFVAIACQDPLLFERIRRWSGPVILGSGCLLLGIFLGQRHFYDSVDFHHAHAGTAVDSSMTLTIGISAVALLFAATLVRIIESSPGSLIQRVLRQNWLMQIGKYSYAMYVFHAVILAAIARTCARLWPSTSGAPDYVAKPLLALVVLGVSFLAAFISYHAFEKHFLRLKRHFSYDKESVPDGKQTDAPGLASRLPSGP